MKRALVMLALFAAVGCRHTHRPWNAPGLSDVKTPPAELAKQTTEHPGDPGERMVVLSGGAYGGAGVALGDGLDALSSFGLELSLHRGESERSHNHDDFFVYPMRSEAVNIGGGFDVRGDGALQVGSLYVEYQRAGIARGWAFGLAVDPDDPAIGPQVTLFFASLYLRASYLAGDGPRIQAGMIIKLPHTWVWSR